ncbi:MAG: tetratricopeptide repeat protein [Planctomycetes bacterium]|nr:tetratricopeptide repeat protein [Planctomycetota bacterium]
MRDPGRGSSTARPGCPPPPSPGAAVGVLPGASAKPREIPGKIPGYLDLHEIQRGGMGAILEGRDPRLNRKVAIKVVRSGGERLARRFLEEAQVAGQLEHPNIVPIYALDALPDGSLYFAMRLVRGKNLAERLDSLVSRSPRDWEDYPLARRLTDFLKACDAVAFAHSRGVIHRDLKPANIMQGEYGEVLVLDWGLARLLDTQDAPPERACATPDEVPVRIDPAPFGSALPERDATVAGSVLGTLGYMPPEQEAGRMEEVGVRSDVYSLGATLYHVLALVRPPEGSSVAEIREAVRAGRIRLPSERDPRRGISRELDAIVAKAMATDPQGRYPDVPSLKRDIEAFLEGRIVSVAHYRPWQLLAKWILRHRGASAVAGAALVILALFGAFSFHRVAVERDSAVEAKEEAQAQSERVARLLSSRERNENALRLLERARSILDRADAYRYMRGADYALYLSRVREGTDLVLQALRVQPDLAVGHHLLGRARYLEGFREDAERAWRRALGLDPELGNARFDLGRLLVENLFLARIAAGSGEDSSSFAPLQKEALAELARAAAGSAGDEGKLHLAFARAMTMFLAGDPAFERAAREAAARFEGVPGVEDFHWLLAVARSGRDRIAAFDKVLEIRPRHALALLWRGKEWSDLGDAARARRDYDAALEIDPRLLLAWNNRAFLRRQAGDPAGAVEDAERALAIDPDYAHAIYNHGAARFELGDLDGALADFERVLSLDPGYASAHNDRARVFLDRGNLAGALAGFLRAAELDPGSADYRYNEAVVRQRMGEPEAARAACDAALALDARFAPAFALRGQLKRLAGDLPAARLDIERALAIDPANSVARHERARLQAACTGENPAEGRPHEHTAACAPSFFSRAHAIEESDPAGARELYNQAIALDPGFFEAWNNRGRLRRLAGDAAGATEDLDRAIVLCPDYAHAWYNRAAARWSMGDLAGALADYDQVLSIDPRYADALVDRGGVKCLKGDLAGALADLDQALSIDAGHVLAIENRGTVRLLLGDRRGALDDFDRVLSTHPDAVSVLVKRAAVRRMLDDPSGALDDLDRAIRLDPVSAPARAERGSVRLALGDYPGAIADSDEALRIDQGLYAAHAVRGISLEQSGDVARAADSYRRALDLAPADWSDRPEIEKRLAGVLLRLGR